MYGHIATATGWTFIEIDQLTLWEVTELFSYWQNHPPTHILVGAYLSGGKKLSSTKRRQTAGHPKFDELTHAVALAGGTLNNVLPAPYKV